MQTKIQLIQLKNKETGDKNEGKITEVSESLSKNSLLGIIGVLSAILLSGLLYWLLSNRQKTDKTELDGNLEKKTISLKTDVISEIEKAKKELQQDNIKLDLKLIEVLENQLKGNKLSETIGNIDEPSTIDHSIPLKVADEITIDLFGQKYDDGKKVTVINEVEDSKLNKGERIIIRIIKPLVKYKGEQIQAAQVDIANGI